MCVLVRGLASRPGLCLLLRAWLLQGTEFGDAGMSGCGHLFVKLEPTGDHHGPSSIPHPAGVLDHRSSVLPSLTYPGLQLES